MLTITSPNAISYLLGEDTIMQIHQDVVRMEYDFLEKSIELYNNDKKVGSYNMLPERRKALEKYINITKL